MSKYTISFVAILAAFFFAYSVTTDISARANQKNDQYSNYLTTATHDAAKQMKTSVEDGIAMPNQADREAVRDTFFKSLAKDFGYTSQEDMESLHVYVPALLLIDTNGYYIVYNQLESGQIKSVLTSLNTWTKSKEDSFTSNGDTFSYKIDVQFFLGNRIKLTLGTDKNAGSWTYHTYDDDYYNVVTKIEKDLTADGKTEAQISSVLETLRDEFGIRKHLGDNSSIGTEERNDVTEALGATTPSVANVNKARDTLFSNFRNSFIIPELEEKVNYYINGNNAVAAVYQDLAANYVFVMPETTEDDWTRLVKNPTVIGFLQGIRLSDGKEFLNIYALSSGEIKKSDAATFTDQTSGDETTRTYYASGTTTDGSESGYVPGNGAATGTGADVITQNRDEKNEQKNDGVYSHFHWGSATEGTGCYTVPVNHVHTTSCYDVAIHNHVDKNGNKTATTAEDGSLIETTQVSADLGGGGCYNTPIYHQHTDSCYTKVFHHHTGNAQEGGGCYTIPLYHVHTSSCYSEGKDITYQPTKDVYHVHKDPIFYYRKAGETSGKEYTQSEVDADTSGSTYYIVRVDATGDTCYSKVTYGRRKYQVTGTKTYSVDKTIEVNAEKTEFTVPAAGKYKITAGDKSIERTLEVSDKIEIEFSTDYTAVTLRTTSTNAEILKLNTKQKVNITLTNGEEYTWTDTKYDADWNVGKKVHYTEAISADAFWTYDGTVQMSKEKEYVTETSGNGKSLLAQGYTYVEMEKTCGKDTTYVEKTVPDGDPITSHKKGELICGKTNKTIISYTTGCGMIDVTDTESAEMQGYRNGDFDADYILSRALERTDIICGKEETTIEGYSLSCGEKENQTIYTLKASETGKENTIDHYELGCGMTNGQSISRSQYEKEQREKSAAGY